MIVVIADAKPRGMRILEECLVEAGIPDAKVLEFHPNRVSTLHSELRRLKPGVTVALGAHACHAVVPKWPDGRSGRDLVHRGNIWSATDIENRRGYVFDSPFGSVVASIDPDAVAKVWTPWRVLLSYDLQRAQEIHSLGHLRRPQRQVEIVTSTRSSRNAIHALQRYGRVAADIETRRDLSLACVGFAGESGKAYVFPERFISGARELLESAELGTVWANGIYDLYVLKHLEGWDIRGRVEDVQLLWHAAYPELAGQKEDRSKNRHTRKSLSFLTSLFTYDEYWKNYDFAPDSQEQYTLNGIDCCTTWDVWEGLQKVGEGAMPTYEHERRLMWPCVDMLARGLKVDNALRVERVERLQTRVAEERVSANTTVIPLLEREEERLEELGVLALFQETDATCACCGHGAKKQMACWACAGFEKAPSKVELQAKFKVEGKVSKAALEAMMPVCHVCCGTPRETRWVFNPNSGAQAKTVLYDLLHLPKKFARNTKGESALTTDEKALKGLLASCA